MSEFNPLPNSLQQWNGKCPDTMMNGNCANKSCQLVHPPIKKVKKKKLQFKKKEFKPSNLVKKNNSVKERMKKKNKANKGKVYHFQPNNNVIKSFKKKSEPTKSKHGIVQLAYQEKLKELEKCNCCHGNYNDCNNSPMCMGLGQCYCKMHLDMENNCEEEQEENFHLGHFISEFPGNVDWNMDKGHSPYPEMMDDFVPESINCGCCNGYIYCCNGPNCMNNCFCVNM
jgi:hypothetical protein